MATLKIREPAGSDTWVEITNTGDRGPAGDTVPIGGLPGETLVKTGPTDKEVGWATTPRVALNAMVADVTSHATAQTYVTVISGDIDVDPARYYHIFTSIRCIADPGATMCTAEARVGVGTVDLVGNDLWTTADTGIWGAWNQNWLELGSDLTATPATLTVVVEIRLSAATSKAIYSPRLYVIEY